ncbi:hypothetical protein GY45DRAFT_1331034 [Cubamyces sp. BRFM 1775]|nr:hypothetical protein GY45DRAFT_1331034 [Cubamyces sp. BRFM 1775]
MATTRSKAKGVPKVRKPSNDSILATFTARNQALQCSDVVEAIFDEMEIWPDTERYTTCARCARVSRSFYGPATRVLWSYLGDDGIFPLWGLLVRRKKPGKRFPKDSHYFDPIVERKVYMRLDLWERFLYHGSLVRELVWHSGLLSPGESAACQLLVNHNDGHTFLPNLRTLTWFHSRDVEHNESVIMLIPPVLVSLNIWMNVQYTDATELINATESVLHPVVDLCPSLRNLSLRLQYIRGERLLPVLSRFKNLHDLRVNRIEWAFRGYFGLEDVRQLLASLPYLRRLDVSIAGFSGNRTSLPPITHPELRFLRCSGTSADLAAFATSLRTPRLTVFWACSTDQEMMRLAQFQLLVRSAVSPPFSESLSRFYTDQEAMCEPVNAVDAFSYEIASFMDIFSPIPSLTHMVDFSLELASKQFTLSLTDIDLLALGRAMPQLRTFRLASLSTRSPRVPSPRGLLQFAVNCPKLEMLELGALRGAPVELPSCVPSTKHPLVELVLKEATTLVKEPKKLATYLHDLFPALSHLTTPSSPPNAIAGWSAVKRIHTSLTPK